MQIAEIQILSNDIHQTEQFYHTLLGLTILSKTSSSISFVAGSSILKFQLSEIPNPLYHFAFNIPRNKIEEAYKWIKSKTDILPIASGIDIADFKDWNAKAFYCYDNNGNILEFIARFDLNNESFHPFAGASILCISEIGLVVDDVKSYCDKLVEKNNLEFFSKQIPADSFTVLGDDHGLLIVVPNARNWYPTTKPSGKYFTKLKLYNGEKTIELLLHENDNG